RVSLCHCLACQRRTGSAFGYQARFAREGVSISGESTRYERTGDSGGSVRFSFCPRCGATVFYELAGLPDIIAVPIGAFADPDFVAPSLSIFTGGKHRWVELPDTMERLA
ncbi:MAG: GFA family protein, partial [Duganella sp.]